MNTTDDIDKLYKKLFDEAKSGGYFLNPDVEFTKELISGLIVNEGRYGYWACPCRLATGNKKEDLDIICPCDYRDADVVEYGACYCALYVSKAVADGEFKASPIPERRGTVKEHGTAKSVSGDLSLPVWRCKVCGYLCARDDPPDICPICKAKRERFERFM